MIFKLYINNFPGETLIEIAIYATMIYTAPCIVFWMRAYLLRGQVGGGWAMESRVCCGPCEMASSR